jgi:hypothetical protein
MIVGTLKLIILAGRMNCAMAAGIKFSWII